MSFILSTSKNNFLNKGLFMKKGDTGKAIKSPLPINAFVYPVKSYKKSKILSTLKY